MRTPRKRPKPRTKVPIDVSVRSFNSELTSSIEMYNSKREKLLDVEKDCTFSSYEIIERMYTLSDYQEKLMFVNESLNDEKTRFLSEQNIMRRDLQSAQIESEKQVQILQKMLGYLRKEFNQLDSEFMKFESGLKHTIEDVVSISASCELLKRRILRLEDICPESYLNQLRSQLYSITNQIEEIERTSKDTIASNQQLDSHYIDLKKRVEIEQHNLTELRSLLAKKRERSFMFSRATDHIVNGILKVSKTLSDASKSKTLINMEISEYKNIIEEKIRKIEQFNKTAESFREKVVELTMENEEKANKSVTLFLDGRLEISKLESEIKKIKSEHMKEQENLNKLRDLLKGNLENFSEYIKVLDCYYKEKYNEEKYMKYFADLMTRNNDESKKKLLQLMYDLIPNLQKYEAGLAKLSEELKYLNEDIFAFEISNSKSFQEIQIKDPDLLLPVLLRRKEFQNERLEVMIEETKQRISIRKNCISAYQTYLNFLNIFHLDCKFEKLLDSEFTEKDLNSYYSYINKITTVMSFEQDLLSKDN